MTNDISETNLEDAVPCFALSKNDSYVMSASGGKISLFNMMTFKVEAFHTHLYLSLGSIAYDDGVLAGWFCIHFSACKCKFSIFHFADDDNIHAPPSSSDISCLPSAR